MGLSLLRTSCCTLSGDDSSKGWGNFLAHARRFWAVLRLFRTYEKLLEFRESFRRARRIALLVYRFPSSTPSHSAWHKHSLHSLLKLFERVQQAFPSWVKLIHFPSPAKTVKKYQDGVVFAGGLHTFMKRPGFLPSCPPTTLRRCFRSQSPTHRIRLNPEHTVNLCG